MKRIDDTFERNDLNGLPGSANSACTRKTKTRRGCTFGSPAGPRAFVPDSSDPGT
jgi:hypothetical protein